MRMELIDRIQMTKVLKNSLEKLDVDDAMEPLQKSIMKTCINYTINLLAASRAIIVTEEEIKEDKVD